MWGLSPEQQHVTSRPHSQVCQSILGEVLTSAQRLPKTLEPGGELGACDALGGRGEVEVRGRR